MDTTTKLLTESAAKDIKDQREEAYEEMDTDFVKDAKPGENPDLKFHEFADIFPMLGSNPEIQRAFVKDIQENGLLEGIILYEGKILDGRNRYYTCKSLGIDYRATPFIGDREDALKHVLSKNLYRRQLTPSQLAVVGLKLFEEYKLDTKVGVSLAPGEPKRDSLKEASKASGASKGSIGKAAKIKRESPDLLKEVAEGNVSINKAHKQVSKPEPAAPAKPKDVGYADVYQAMIDLGFTCDREWSMSLVEEGEELTFKLGDMEVGMFLA